MQNLIFCKNMVNESQIKNSRNENNQQTEFNKTNPFYHLQKALQNLSPQQESQRYKILENMKTQINEMKQLCQKLMTNETDVQQQRKKTLIMYLQNLQTRRTNFDEPFCSSAQSCVSINNFIEKKQQYCKHTNCDKINSILQKASEKINQLILSHKIMQKQLEEQALLKQKASKQNKQLRQQIAKLDEIQCKEIQMLKKQLQKLKKMQHLNQQKNNQVVRTPNLNQSQKQRFQQTNIKVKVPSKQISPRTQQKNQKTYVRPKNSQIKLKNLVYL